MPEHDLPWVPLNDLSRALANEKEALLSAFADVIDSGWLVQGPQHDAFETELAAFIGAKHAVGVATGTDAIELALRALMPEGRDVVLTAANCGAYTTTAALRAGFEVRYADIDEATLCLGPEQVAEAIGPEVGVVVVTHLYGRAADVAAVRALTEPLGIAVLEDCAQALGAQVDGRRVGSFGDAASFSFYPTKNLGALGDGGAIATSRDDVATRVRTLRQYGWSAKYEITVDGGRNSRLDEVQAAVLRRRLGQLDGWNTRRREIISKYAAAASARVRVLPADGPHHVAHLAVIVTDDREALRKHLAEARIRTEVHYPVADHQQPAFAERLRGIMLPTTERMGRQILTVPVFPELRDDEVDRVCHALASF